ncbi:MAG: hypothetical protein ABI072_01675 [Edaphobacter sp.]
MANQAMTQGTLGNSAILVTPLNGYTGNITFAATGSSPGFANGCVLFSNYVNVSGVNPTTVGDMTIATKNWDCPPDATGKLIGGGNIGSVSGSGFRQDRKRDSKPLGVALGGVLLTGLLGLRSHKLRRLACLLVLVTLGGFAIGCSEPAPLLTPKGNYVLTVVGTDSGATPNITATTTFTVVVQ